LYVIFCLTRTAGKKSKKRSKKSFAKDRGDKEDGGPARLLQRIKKERVRKEKGVGRRKKTINADRRPSQRYHDALKKRL